MNPTADEMAAAKLLIREEYRPQTWIVLVRLEEGCPTVVGVWTIAELNKHVSECVAKHGEDFFRRANSFNDLEYTAYRVGMNAAEDKVAAAQAVKAMVKDGL